jgi:hypothetical protein
MSGDGMRLGHDLTFPFSGERHRGTGPCTFEEIV